jgi:hypothetical protein
LTTPANITFNRHPLTQTTMLKKLTKDEPAKIIAKVANTKYTVSSDGRVFRELKPTVIQGKHYYNIVVEGVLRRFSKDTLIEELPNG